MTVATVLALSELRILARDRIAAFNVVVLPVVAAGWLVVKPPPADELPGPVAAAGASVVLVVFTSAAMVLRSVTTLVQRREGRLLERWRVSGAAPAAILTGTLAPGVLLLVGGVAAMFPALAIALDDAPAQPGWLLLAVVLAAAVGATGATVAAAFARTSEAAATVALPLFAALLGGGMWATFVPLGEITWRMRATGGGALTELVRVAWQGPPDAGGTATLEALAPSVLVLVGLAAVLSAVAIRTFRWNPRH